MGVGAMGGGHGPKKWLTVGMGWAQIVKCLIVCLIVFVYTIDPKVGVFRASSSM